MKVFLTAQWKYLINLTYAVDPEVLYPHLPNGLSLDLIEGKAFVSFVAFEFNDVCVKGFKIPFHRNFPEINLRFYVNDNKGKRGVVFIKEYVPKYFIALVANRIYNEPYSAIKMRTTSNLTKDILKVEHSFCVNNQWFDLSVTADAKTTLPGDKSAEHFFKEHEIGFGRDKKGNTLAYKVEHPVWEIFPIRTIESTICFEKIYGAKWAFLNSEKPYNSLLAKGSDVKVFEKNS